MDRCATSRKRCASPKPHSRETSAGTTPSQSSMDRSALSQNGAAWRSATSSACTSSTSPISSSRCWQPSRLARAHRCSQIQSAKAGFARYAWFQRLADPGPGATELHGIVRLEAAADVGFDVARGLANAATTWLPKTAPKRARDPRSPQNLLPIGALEQRLRVQLGDARLIRRWIQTLVAKEASYG